MLNVLPARGLFLVLLSSALIPLGCKKEAAKPDVSAEQATIELPFTPPQDGLISLEQVDNYLKAQAALSELMTVYLDSLAKQPAEYSTAIQQRMELAQEKLCRRSGLLGFEEYEWILREAAKYPHNVALFRERGVQIAQ